MLCDYYVVIFFQFPTFHIWRWYYAYWYLVLLNSRMFSLKSDTIYESSSRWASASCALYLHLYVCIQKSLYTQGKYVDSFRTLLYSNWSITFFDSCTPYVYVVMHTWHDVRRKETLALIVTFNAAWISAIAS